MDKLGQELTKKSRQKKHKQLKSSMNSDDCGDMGSKTDLAELPPIDNIGEKVNKNSGKDLAERLADGVSIEVYAVEKKIHTGEVWRRIRSGALIARPLKGKLFIFDESSVKPDNSRQGAFTNTLQEKLEEIRAEELQKRQAAEQKLDDELRANAKKQLALEVELKNAADEATKVKESEQLLEVHHDKDCSAEPVLRAETEKHLTALDLEIENLQKSADVSASTEEKPKEEDEIENLQLPILPNLPVIQRTDAAENTSMLAFPAKITDNAELALLLDHLSLAKEENKEILKLTQDTIKRVTEMSESIVEMKNEIIDAKDTQIDSLKGTMDQQTRELRKLRQENEDLEMLANSVAELD